MRESNLSTSTTMSLLFFHLGLGIRPNTLHRDLNTQSWHSAFQDPSAFCNWSWEMSSPTKGIEVTIELPHRALPAKTAHWLCTNVRSILTRSWNYVLCHTEIVALCCTGVARSIMSLMTFGLPSNKLFDSPCLVIPWGSQLSLAETTKQLKFSWPHDPSRGGVVFRFGQGGSKLVMLSGGSYMGQSLNLNIPGRLGLQSIMTSMQTQEPVWFVVSMLTSLSLLIASNQPLEGWLRTEPDLYLRNGRIASDNHDHYDHQQRQQQERHQQKQQNGNGKNRGKSTWHALQAVWRKCFRAVWLGKNRLFRLL